MKRRLKILFLLGRPLAPFYAGIMALRAYLYRRGVFRSEKLPVPVICIGNLTMGGTGKTPLVMAITRMLQVMGRKPALVSRGYGGRAREAVNVVADGRTVLLDAAAAGDEPKLLAESLPGVPVLTGKRRALGGREAIARFGADSVVLDDGFQHLALARDLDLVLFNAHAELQEGRVFPGGGLRESFGALARAHAVIITGVEAETNSKAEEFRRFLQGRFPGLPVFTSGYRPVTLRKEPGAETCALATVKEMDLCGFCGIATPESFRQILAGLGCRLRGFRSFRDHYRYGRADLEKLVRWARRQGGRGLITTEKDFVKIAPFCKGGLPVFVLRVELTLDQDFIWFLKKQMARWHSE
jgi:tetraacyldisaccharide 4'-kinase